MSARKTLIACLGLALLCAGLFVPAAQADFGIAEVSTVARAEDGTIVSQAGARPYSYSVTVKLNEDANHKPEGSLSNVVVNLPAGLVGNPQAVPTCARSLFVGINPTCPPSTQVGIVKARFGGGVIVNPVANLAPPLGVPAMLGFSLAGFNQFATASVRTGGDYGITAADPTLPTSLQISEFTYTLWGNPADPSHDPERYCKKFAGNGSGETVTGCTTDLAPAPFLTLPTSCSGSLETTVQAESLEEPGHLTPPVPAFSRDAGGNLQGLGGCGKLPFTPTIAVAPETSAADSPTGLHVNLHIPQHDLVAEGERELVPLNEVQSVGLSAETLGGFPTEGELRLGFKGQSTAELPFNASIAEVQEAIEALSTVGAGNVVVSGVPGHSYVFSFRAALGEQDLPSLEALFTSAAGQAQVSTTRQGRAPGERTAVGEPELAAAHLKGAVVTLPQGMVLNPSAADGLAACSPAEIDLHGAGPANCPAASKVATVSVSTPLLDHPVSGAVYLAKQGENPFGTLLALYIGAYDPTTGVVIKLAGKVEPDPVTGQLKATFSENPQLPFEDLDLDFFGGPRAALTTPATCGSFQTTSDLTPWSAPEGADAFPASGFSISSGAGGGACASSEAELPNSPAFEAGTATPLAGAFSPFVLKLSRENGTQHFGALNVTLPPGLSGKLAGTEECSDAAIAQAAARANPGEGALEKASPSCPADSELGVVNVGAGSGSPFYVQGHAYLAGPYKGAPLSMAIITPAVAGPFDLGTVVVRSALFVDETTAQITVKSDPIPTILHGIPLDVRWSRSRSTATNSP